MLWRGGTFWGRAELITDENSVAQHNTLARKEMKGIKTVVNKGTFRQEWCD